MNIKLLKTSLVLGVVVGAVAWYLIDSAQVKEAELKVNVYGDWVAAEGFCNTNVKGIDGVDITNEFLLKNGKRIPIDKILITEQETSIDRCDRGQIEYDFEFTLLPVNETYLHGSMADFQVIKSVHDSVVYFKMSQEFKKAYELFIVEPE
ncbi:MAG: hypothetical protein V7749_00370 [Cocleimonas sp.]